MPSDSLCILEGLTRGDPLEEIRTSQCCSVPRYTCASTCDTISTPSIGACHKPRPLLSHSVLNQDPHAQGAPLEVWKQWTPFLGQKRRHNRPYPFEEFLVTLKSPPQAARVPTFRPSRLLYLWPRPWPLFPQSLQSTPRYDTIALMNH
jgi:hypothetical protein